VTRPRITTILGARPQFIKAAPVSRALRRVCDERLVHTGQHYDAQMSAIFFAELGLPAPDVELHVGSASHGAQTGRMLEALDAELQTRRPDAVLVYGDTNSTLAGALAAAKLGIPVVHVEAGLRSFVRDMPEEINRIVTDRLSTVCCCPSDTARRHLAAEGITDGVFVVGDVMFDAIRDAAARVSGRPELLEQLALSPGSYALATIHRAVNTDDAQRLRMIIEALGALDLPVCWPVHPRTRAAMARDGIALPPNVLACEPLGYLALAAVLTHAAVVVTDSGGLQKEAYWLGVPCVTVREETEWVETVATGWNTLVGTDVSRLVSAARSRVRPDDAERSAYGVPGAAERVADVVARLISP
jgi:UDP-N-acetylglucosamine 2-epimerase